MQLADSDAHIVPIQIVLLMLLFASLACVAQEKMGPGLLAECTPVTFTLRGETDHVWEMELVPETRYSVTVENLGTIHPADQIDISVKHNQDFIGENTAHPRDGNTATTTFVSPASGHVQITVISKIGESGNDLGRHRIMVCEI